MTADIGPAGGEPGPGAASDRSPGAASDAILRTEALVHVYGGATRALDGVDLEIRRGARVAIVGQNGSGKSTLVRHFNGLLRPTEGRVLVDGTDAAGRRVAHLAATVGLAFQDPDRQIFAGKVRTEVGFGPRNLGLGGAELATAVDAALVATGLDRDAQTNPYDLGYSRRKLLALASILAMGTPVVVLDEPTTGQDARGLERIRHIVADLSAAGRTVVAVSHDMRFVAEAFERIVVMRDGRIVLDGTPAEVFAETSWPTLASTFLEPPLPARIGARLGLGSTPTDEALLAAVGQRGGSRRPTAGG
jgi:energy-coupling factor transport system ATP-binding protein